jgi:hypothetical protein
VATVAVQDVTRAGTTPTPYNASAGGDKFPAGAGVTVRVINGSGSAVTPTFATPGQVSGLDIADLVGGSTPASGAKVYGPFPPELFADSSGLVAVTWSATTTVTFEVMRIPS